MGRTRDLALQEGIDLQGSSGLPRMEQLREWLPRESA